jgi:predicted ATPase
MVGVSLVHRATIDHCEAGNRMTSEADYKPEKAQVAGERFVVISGCSGGGKSSLVDELAARGYRTFAEPGRQIIREQATIGRPRILDEDPALFGELCIARTMHRMIETAGAEDWVFFDRGIVDAVSYRAFSNPPLPPHWKRAAEVFRFHRTVFFVPPWPEIFRQDAERTHSFETCLAEYPVLLESYEQFGYRSVIVPKVPVPGRADFVLATLKRPN